LARRCAVQALYQWQMTGQAPEEIIATFISNENLTGKHRDYFLALINIIPQYIEKIDALIAPHLDRKQDRVDLIEQAILRLGAYELQYDKSIPTGVVIDEAIDIAKVFCSEHGYKYVNGVLDKVAGVARNGQV
jgi:N utilization substance protein B